MNNDKTNYGDYEMTIGIECHTQLKTKTKLFSGASNESNDADPNTCISPICLGLPGVLPVLNERAIELAVKAGIALNAEINLVSKFDRKHYFYPDLPKGYQITQLYEPIIGKGSVEINVDGETKTVGVTRAHLEEDAGKLTHSSSGSYVDLNRAGSPLLEIVSEPDMHSPAEARAYAHTLYLLMKHAGASDADLYHGNMRFDVNISIAKKDAKELGTRAEIKNLNSFRSVEKSAEYEFKRQVELLEAGKKVDQETRGWDDNKLATFSQRGKEVAHDYRYMPEPDVPPIVLEQKFVDNIRSNMPKLPAELISIFGEMGVDTGRQEMLLEEPLLSSLIIESSDSNRSTILNWATSELTPLIDSGKLSWSQVAKAREDLEKLAEMYLSKKLSSTSAKNLLADIITGASPEQLAKDKNLLQVSDDTAITEIVTKVLAENPKAVADIRAGEERAIGFLVGQVMKMSQGKANPAMAKEIIKQQIEKAKK